MVVDRQKNSYRGAPLLKIGGGSGQRFVLNEFIFTAPLNSLIGKPGAAYLTDN